MKKRILSILLSLCMVCMLLPTAALADSGISVQAAEDPNSHSHDGWTEISTEAALQSLTGKGYLTAKIQLTDTWEPEDGVVLCLNGKTITGADGKDAIQVNSGVTFTLTDCHTGNEVGQITHKTDASGCGVYVQYGTFNMYGGSITGNTVGGGNGGGVCATNSSTFNMYGGSITGNHATFQGGGVYATSTFNMYGGTISGNSASQGGGVFVSTQHFTVSGNAKITDNTNNGASEKNNVYLNYSGTSIQIGTEGLQSGAKIGVTTYATPSNSAPVTIVSSDAKAGYEEYFTSDKEGCYPVYQGGKIVLYAGAPHKHPICGETCADGEHTQNITWTPIETEGELKAASANGYYYLTKDVTLTSTWTPANGVKLCLNGHTITANHTNNAIMVESKATFTLTDCQSTPGTITHNYSESNQKTGRGVYVSTGTFNMYGGTITGNKDDNGGGVYVYNSTGTFNMSGGTISNNTASYGGGGVYVLGGTFTMTGGSITGNKATSDGGGGVYVYSTGTFNMSGGSITGNTATNSDGGGVYVYTSTFNMSGGVQIKDNCKGGILDSTTGKYTGGSASNVYLPNSKTITIGTGGLTTGAEIGVTTSKDPTEGQPIRIVGSNAEDGYEEYIKSDKGYYPMYQGGVIYLYKSQPHIHPICGKTCARTGSDVHTDVHTDVIWTPLTIENGEPYAGSTALNEGWFNKTKGYVLPEGHYYLSDALNLNLPLLIENGVYLCLNGQTLRVSSSNSAVIIDTDCDLTLCDCSEEQRGTITHAASATGRGVYMGTSTGTANNYNGSFTMYGGSISGNRLQTGGGSGVYMEGKGTFNMHGGTIRNNRASSYGGGVFVYNGSTFEMSGGSITENEATYGGGVYVDYGTFEMSGGSITKNEATDYNGGGVYVCDRGTFNMSGDASITDNTAFYKGGGVYVDSSSTMTVSGGVKITGNKRGDDANNVYLPSNSSVSPPQSQTITITGALTNDASIGVTKTISGTTPVTIAQGETGESAYTITSGDANHFFPDAGSNYLVFYNDAYGDLRLKAHQHNWTYNPNSTNNTITANCEYSTECGNTGETLTISASNATYDGNAKAATLSSQSGLVSDLASVTVNYQKKTGDSTYDTATTTAPTNAGTYKASITVGEAEAYVTYTISQKEVTNPTIEVGSAGAYDGTAKTPTVTVKDGGTTIPASEYTIVYNNNINAGNTATVTITDKAGGNYTLSEKQQTFEIARRSITVAEASSIADQTYTGSPITPSVSLAYSNMTLMENTDYTLSYSNHTNAGTATVTITGNGNYTGTKDITFNIKKADMTGITVTGYNAAYDGNAHGISVTIPAEAAYADATVKYGTSEDACTQDSLTYTDAGTYTVYYKVSKANYNNVTGSATVNITKATLVVDGTLAASANYGTAVKGIKNFSGATVKLGGTTIAGTWAFPSDATTVPNVGATTPYTATFTPNDGAGNYETLTQSVTPTISKVNPTAPTGLTGKQGNTLSTVRLPEGWEWVNANAVMNETGDKNFEANYTDSTGNYNDASDVNVTVTVSSKASQTNFKFAAATQTKIYGDADFTIAATGAETGSTVTYESSNISVATVDNSGKVHILKAGTATITATASATLDYAKTTASYALTVNKGTQTITVPDDKTIIKNGVAVDISDWARVAGVANGAAPGALSYALNSTYAGVTLSDGKNLTVDSSATATSITIKVTAAEKEDYYNKATETFDVTVSAKGSATLTVTQDGWTYGDDTKSPSYTKPVDTIDDTIEVTYAVKGSGVFSASAPNNAGNYTVKVVLETADTVYSGTADFTISPKTLTSDDLEFTTGSTFTKVYDGNTTCATATVQIKENVGDALPDVSGTCVYNSANVNEASEVTFTSASSSNTNYVLPAGLICVHAASITKADQAALTVTSTTATYGTDLTLTVSGGTGDGAVTYVVTDGADKATVSESTLHPTKAGTVTVTATKSGGDNYNDVSSSATAITINKATPVVTPPSPVASLTYNGEEQTLITAGSTTGGELKYCLTSDGDYSTALPKATAAGDSNVYYKVVGDENFVDVAESYITVNIAKKNVTVAPKSVTITQGDAIPAFELTYTGLVGSDTLTPSADPAFTCYEADGTTPVSTGTAVGTYTITWTNEGVTTFTGDANYNVTKNATGTLTISARPAPPSDSGSSYNPPTYKVESEVTESTDGNVSFSKNNAKKGDTVTITVTPDRYYKVDGVTVKDKNGKEIAVTDNGDGTFSFKMPASKVTVEPVFSWDNPFTDVAEDTYYTPAVEWALKNDITNGAGDDTTFGPDAECTRAQIVTFLWRAAGCPEPAGLSSFADVSADAYYAKAVAWAVEQGITNGTGDGTTFSPDATCTRSQGVTFLYRSVGSPEVSDDIAFNDVTTGSYYSDAVVWATQNGVTDGTGNSKFSPVRDCTRAQIVTFLYRWMVK